MATVISFAAAIAELGLNPFVDGITVFFGSFTEQEGADVVNVSEDITQADSQTATELQTIEDDLANSPEITGSPISPGEPDVSPVSIENLDNMTAPDDLTNAELDEYGNDSNTLNAKNNSNFFKNPINMSMESTEANMPPGVNNDIGKSWIQKIEDLGVRVEWNRSVQTTAENNNALGFTDNRNVDPENGTTTYVVVGLSPDADNTTAYEEYLHVQAAEARGWMPPSNPPAGVWSEEIKVEYQVLQNAENLDMSDAAWNRISQGVRTISAS